MASKPWAVVWWDEKLIEMRTELFSDRTKAVALKENLLKQGFEAELFFRVLS